MAYDLQTTDTELMEARNWIIEASIKRYIFHGETPEEARAIVRGHPHDFGRTGMTYSPDQSDLSPTDLE